MNAKIAIALFSALFLFCCSQPEEAKLCGGKYFYNEQTEFCPNEYYEFPPKVYAKCNGQEYDPKVQTCSEDGSKLLYHCNGVVYEPPSQFCSNNGVADKGTFTDLRDNKEYKTVVIGEQIWMAENLNYETSNSQCYDDDPENCAVYGRLYDWETALAVCPEGWHLPDRADIDILLYDVGSTELKAISGWKKSSYGHSSDAFGFSALPGGYASDGHSENIGESSFWWSSEDVRWRHENYSVAVYFYLEYWGTGGGTSIKSVKMSVRCVKHPS
ncbi:MAG: fibrobacter succinogenes major paralogous domain-containing protein [Fibromonadales bacterium]|nr:fibrobacter succinogenes major paralogous domain-containing protein [Fibromonadales bacterium]